MAVEETAAGEVVALNDDNPQASEPPPAAGEGGATEKEEVQVARRKSPEADPTPSADYPSDRNGDDSRAK
eukprot:scaffold445852_cov29-Prasinocladus_malaysianus.AAC.1